MATMAINAQNYAALTAGERVPRKYAAHALDVTFGGQTPEWVRLGDDLEDFTVEMNPDTETTKNILGVTSFRHSGYEPSADADTFYARVRDKLFLKLQNIVDTQATGDTCKTKMLEVHMWKSAEVSSATAYEATVQECYVVPTSTGGGTDGYQIPFSVTLIGERTMGAFTPPATSASTGTFTAGTWTEGTGGTWTFTATT